MELVAYFHSIHGSPEKKSAILNRILKEHQHDPSSCLMIGDAKNDYDAAVEKQNSILGFNNPEIEQLTNIDFTLSDPVKKRLFNYWYFGFIGSKIAYKAIENGYHVVGVDDLSMGNENNIPPNVDFYAFDLSKKELLEQLPKKH